VDKYQIRTKLIDQWNELRSKANIPEELGDYILYNAYFPEWSGAGRKESHHYGVGGLIIHTNEVIDLMFLAKVRLNLTTPDHMIFLSALWHDYGKLWDYQPIGDEWQNDEHKYKIHHLPRSAIEWNIKARSVGYDVKETDEITHAILSHHGQKAWGSPVEPRSELAWLLHISDHMSARLDDWKTINN
jgi:3'-5' exoribonuclease